MTKTYTNTVIDPTSSVLSTDGTTISYLTTGGGPAVIVIPGVLSMAADYATFARSLAEQFAVHTIERRGRGESGPQGDDYSIVKECEDVLALQKQTGASFLVGHSFGGLVALEVARHNQALTSVSTCSSSCTKTCANTESRLALIIAIQTIEKYPLAYS